MISFAYRATRWHIQIHQHLCAVGVGEELSRHFRERKTTRKEKPHHDSHKQEAHVQHPTQQRFIVRVQFIEILTDVGFALFFVTVGARYKVVTKIRGNSLRQQPRHQ